MRGPPPKPTHLRLLQGNPSRRPINKHEPQPPPVETVDPPDYLEGYARAEWLRVAPSLLTNLDIHLLGAFCVSYARWREAEEKLVEFRAKDSMLGGLLVKGSNNKPMINPLLKISRLMASDMLRYAAEFGFTPAARTRISVGASSGLGEFEGLIG
jgi:P27 family predicted phage terminase small subunit